MSFADFKLIGLNRFPTSLYMWGDNTNGLLGDNKTPSYFSWSKISSGGLHTVAIRNDGTLWGWGRNSEGQLGLADTVHRSFPTQISSVSWNQISTGLSHTTAIRGDSTLWTWGANRYGQLGDSTTVTKSTLTQVPGTYIGIAAGGNHTVAAKPDTTVFAWGLNNSGQLGDTTLISRSSPVQVGATGTVLTIDTAYSLYFSGSNYIALDNNATMDIGTSDFTIEFWLNSLRWPAGVGDCVFSAASADTTTTFGLLLESTATGWGFYLGDGNAWVVSQNTILPSTTVKWQHLAISRTGGTLYIFVNGALVYSAANTTAVPSSWFKIGAQTRNSHYFNGYISNFRVIIGSGIYSSAFTPSTTPLTAITNTALLAAQTSSPIQDNSGLFKTITNYGTVIYSVNTPFPSAVAIGSLYSTNVAAGKSHTIALTTSNQIYAWGDNTYGEVGDGTIINRSAPVQVSASSWAQVSAGGTHTAAIKSDGSLYTWGLDNYGQLGDQSGYSGYYWSSIAYGDKHTIAIRNDGTLWGWGRNNSGQLGQSDTITRSSPTQIGTDSWMQVGAGLSHSIAVRSDGKLFAWGDNAYGQLGNDPAVVSTVWSKITISSTATHTLAIKNDGTLWAWGLGTSGQLGDNTALSKSSPVQVGALDTWTDIAAGSTHSLGITKDTTLYAWGLGTSGQLGDNTLVTKSSPVVVGYGYKSVYAGATISAAIDINNLGYFWGYNVNGAIGDGTTVTRSSPTLLGNDTWKQFSISNHVLALKTTNTLWAWGLGTWGVQGLNDIISRSSPVQVGTSSWLSVSAGPSHSVALAADNTIWLWGTDQGGQLGQNLVTDRSSPVQLGTGVDAYSWTTVNAGALSTSAIRTDGTLWVWGNNALGNLGQNDTLNRSSPVQVGTGSWSNVWSTGSHVLAVDSTTAYYAWGMNTTGQIADYTIINRSSPVQVSTTTPSLSSPVQIGSSSWSSISAGYYHNMGIGVDGILYGWGRNDQTQIGGAILGTLWSKVVVSGTHTLAIKYNGTLWAWGANATGQLGDGTVVAKNSPVAVTVEGSRTSKFIDVAVGQGALYTSFAVRNDGKLFAWGNNSVGQLGIFSWKQVSVGTGHSLLLRNDGQLYAWGLNNVGQLGDATTVNKSVVTLVGLTSNSWVSVNAGVSTSAAIRADGTLYTWGLNNLGQLGITTTTNRSSPTQVPGSWSQVALEDYALALNAQGSLWSWGNNNNGQLGLGDTINRKTPRLLDGTTITYSAAFDGIGDYVSIPASNNWAMGTGDFTIEAWIYPTSFAGVFPSIATQYINATQGVGNWAIQLTQTTGLLAIYYNGNVSFNSTIAPTLNAWTHVALVRIGSGTNNLVLYMNGVRRGSVTYTGVFGYSTQALLIGAQDGPVDFYQGYISNVRVVKGVGVYSGNFTVPTAPLATTQGLSANIGAITNQTVLLTLQDSTFKDNANNAVVTAIGTPQLSGFNPVTNMATATGKSWSKVAAGSHSLAISNGTLYTWGLNTYGQLGVGDTISRSSPVVVDHTDGSWTVISASMTGHSAAIDILGALHTWGNNSWGELGIVNEYQSASTPVQITGYSYTQVSTGYNTTMAVAATAAGVTTVYGMGRNDANQLDQITPYTVGSVQQGAYIQIAPGYTQGRLFVWGSNTYGTQGNNDTATRSSPVQVGGFYGPSNYKTVLTTPNNTLALTTDGTLYIWGDNTYGQLGQGDTLTRSSPVQVGGNAEWSSAAISQTGHVIAVSRNGTLFAWGNNQYQELGQSQPVVTNFSSPVIIGSDADWSKVSVGNNFSMAIKTSGALYTWGRNDAGQVGTSVTLSYTAIGAYSAVRSDGKLVTWGVNDKGQLGLSDAANRSAPTQVATAVNSAVSWTQVAGSLNNRGGIKRDGKLYLWGDNRYGQLGQLDTTSRSAPTQVGVSSWTQLYVNIDNVFAIRSDNTLWAWGRNNLGQLGDSTTIDKSIPTQILPGTFWSSVVAGPSGHVMAIKNDSTLWGWGNNLYNELGQVQTVVGINSSSPTQIGTESYIQVAAGVNFTMALRSDYSLWGWGRNSIGQIGLNNTPLSWTQVAGGQSFAVAIRSDGRLYAWGNNQYGQLGLNNTTSKLQPSIVSYPSPIGNMQSTLFNGTSSVLTVADNSAFNFADLDFTIEAWIYPTTTSVVRGIINNWSTGGEYSFSIDASNKLNFSYTNVPSGISTVLKTGLTNIVSSQWTHVAVVRNGSTLTFYVNGAVDTSFDITGTTLYYYNGQSKSTYIGVNNDGANFFTGNISNLRIVKGKAVYTGQFTVPIAALSTVQSSSTNIASLIGTETSLLTCQEDVAVDRSVNNITITSTATTTSVLTPFAQSNGYSWSQVSASLSHVAALRNDGTLWTWGRNDSGQLAQGDTIDRSAPVQIGSNSWIAVTTGRDATFAINTANELFVVGKNDVGQLGTNDVSSRSTIVQVAGSWSTVSSSSTGHTLGIETDGSLFAWGANDANELGLASDAGFTYNPAPQHSSPVQIGTSSWSQVSAGNNYSMAIRSDGALFAWGKNDMGQLGVVTAVGSFTSIGALSAIRADGKAYNWGYNFAGQLGINDSNNRSAPTQILSGNSWTIVSLGNAYRLALRQDGTLWAWGLNNLGQLGTSDTVYRSSPVQVGSSSWLAISAGDGSGYGIGPDYTVWSWGNGANGRLGLGDTNLRSNPVQITSLPNKSWIQISGGEKHAFVLASDGTLYGWGENGTGALGDLSLISRSLPVQISGENSWSVVSAGLSNSAAIRTSDKALFTWGINTGGVLGDNSTVTKSSPTKVGSSSWSTVSAGFFTMAGIDIAGKLYTWGTNANGNLGGSSTVAIAAATVRSNPVQIGPAGLSWTQVTTSVGGTTFHAFTTTKLIYGWGFNSNGEVGDASTTNRSAPVQIGATVITSAMLDIYKSPAQVGALTTWSRIQAGTSWTAGLLTDGKLFMWGGNANYELGVGTTASRSSPVQLGTSSWTVVGGRTLPIARTSLGTMFTWGSPNTSGQLGLGDTALRSQPVQITTPSLTGVTLDTVISPTQIGASSWSAVAAGDSFVGAINTLGQLFTWGLGTTGQLGSSALTSRSSPVQVSTPASSWTALASHGTSNMFAISTAYTLFSWGTGANGAMGDNTTVTKSVPTAIGLLTNIPLETITALTIPAAGSYKLVSAGDSHAMAVRGDGALFTWGKNDQFQLGSSAGTPRSSPVQVGTALWAAISAGNSISAGIDTLGRMYTWGRGNEGQQGSAATLNRSAPTQVGTSSWSQIAAGTNSMIGTTVSNIVFVWGQNNVGQLGLADTVNRSSPTQLGSSLLSSMYQTLYTSPAQVNTFTNASWVQVGIGDSFSVGIDNSGRLYAWGQNNVGQLGDNSTINTMPAKSSPTQIATTASSFVFVNASSPVQVTGGGSYAAVAAGGTHTVAIRSDGSLWGWGINTYGQVGTNSILAQYVPKQTDLNNSYVAVAAGTDFSAGINSVDRSLWRWGFNASVDPISPHRSNPQQLGAVAYSTVSIANATAYAVSTTGLLYEWGRTTTDDNFYFNQDIAQTLWARGQSYLSVNAGDSQVHAIRSDSSLWAYGLNNNGQLGTNDTVTRSSPVQIGALQSWTLLGGGIGGPAMTAGGLFRTGLGTSGQLGLGDATSRSSPTQIPAAAMNIYTQPVRVGTNRWNRVSAGATHTVALLSDNTLYAWGYNATGQVGDSTVAVKNSPVLISNSSYTSISAGKDHSVALKIDNTIWAWGLNTSGQLGDNTNVTKSVPTLITPAYTGYWNSVVAGTSHTSALADNNTLWVWGDDNYG